MTNNGIVNIHGKDYMTVAKRVDLARNDRALESVETEVLNHNPVVVRAKVTLNGKVFTGISSVNLESPRLIEKQNPYEVAETSAVGRALGFAGYGILEGIASADEMVQAITSRVSDDDDAAKNTETTTCETCGQPATERKGVTKNGKPYHGIFCSSKDRTHTKWLWN